MPELVAIPTITTVAVLSGNISITTFYVAGQGFNNVIAIEIKDTVGTQDGVDFVENDLVALVKNYLDPLNIYLTSEGELIIEDDNADQYQINSAGDLEFVE